MSMSLRIKSVLLPQSTAIVGSDHIKKQAILRSNISINQTLNEIKDNF